MSIYKYTALALTGDKIKGTIEANDVEEARRILLRKKVQVQKISLDWQQLQIGEKKVKNSDIVLFTRQMAAMTDAGLPLNRSLDILIEESKPGKFRKILQAISYDVSSGESFSSALKKHPKVFSSLYTNMVLSGEIAGKPAIVLARLAEYMENSDEINKKVKGAMIYPLAVLSAAFLAVMILYYKVLPQFEPMFEELDNLPAITKFNLAASRFVRHNTLQFASILVGLFFGIKYLLSVPQLRLLADRISFRVPVLGKILMEASIARFARTLSTLLSNGVPLVEAITLTGETAGNYMVRKAIESAKKAIYSGSDIAETLSRASVFPPMVIQMIRVGEETGKLADMLDKVATIYEQNVKRSVENSLKLIEPVMILVVGFIIAGILMSIYLPLFDTIATVE